MGITLGINLSVSAVDFLERNNIYKYVPDDDEEDEEDEKENDAEGDNAMDGEKDENGDNELDAQKTPVILHNHVFGDYRMSLAYRWSISDGTVSLFFSSLYDIFKFPK